MPIIIAEFNQIQIKEKMQLNFKTNGPPIHKQILKTNDTVNNNRKIYINDYLCPYKKQLFEEAKKLKEKFNFKYVWNKNGNLFLRFEVFLRNVFPFHTYLKLNFSFSFFTSYSYKE